MGCGSGIWDPGSGNYFSRIPDPDPGVQKAPNPGFGSVTLSKAWFRIRIKVKLNAGSGMPVSTIFFKYGTESMQEEVPYFVSLNFWSSVQYCFYFLCIWSFSSNFQKNAISWSFFLPISLVDICISTTVNFIQHKGFW